MVPNSGDVLTIRNSVLTDTITNIMLIVNEDIDKIANDKNIVSLINIL